MNEIVDLRDGFRVEVEMLVWPRDTYAARLYRPRISPSGRTTWKQVGPMVQAETPESAARDLMDAVNAGLLPGVEASA